MITQGNWMEVSGSIAMSMYVMVCISLILITLNFLVILYIIIKSDDEA